MIIKILDNQQNLNNSNNSKQIELFNTKDISSSYSKPNIFNIQSRDEILKWQKKINKFQQKILKDSNNSYLQKAIIEDKDDYRYREINPFELASHSINFWRSKKLISRSSAIYFVIDNIENSEIILYIGETFSADERWKGVHDCKTYINNYRESLNANNIKSHLDIRFFLDVPKEVKFRRKLEKQLIYLWFPPFNKETRNIWCTTFTNI